MKVFFEVLYYVVYLPVITILSFLLFVFPRVRERVLFENKNLKDKLAQSFSLSGEKADICFEFSSEGEFQQVASLVEDGVAAGKKIELVFFSKSVEKAIVELAAKYPQNIRYLRYPLLTSAQASFSKWVTAQTLVLVRYDLFPEFLLWSFQKDHVLKMLSVTFKRERIQGKGVSFFKKMFLQKARGLFFASEADLEFAHGLGIQGRNYDFRMEQIRRRLLQRREKFQRLFPQYSELSLILEKYPREKRVILGNAWPSDLSLLNDLPSDVLLMVVPHQLSQDILEKFHSGLKALGRTGFEINESGGTLVGETFILNKKGLLCELYADFGRAYVGGGLDTSVHSILEPLVAGSEELACGPVHHRSTEYDVALSLGKITEVQSSEDFNQWLKSSQKNSAGGDEVLGLVEQYAHHRKEVLSC